MRYDKTGSGWGRGDAVWACDAKRGNCTDFHSPFIGMLRVDGIPARFDIGFPLPENKDKGDIAGYHCWAEFYARKTGWIPVDISEAWKAKQKEDYFFGSVDANRVQLSTGRDVALSPKQDGPALNYSRGSVRRASGLVLVGKQEVIRFLPDRPDSRSKRQTCFQLHTTGLAAISKTSHVRVTVILPDRPVN